MWVCAELSGRWWELLSASVTNHSRTTGGAAPWRTVHLSNRSQSQHSTLSTMAHDTPLTDVMFHLCICFSFCITPFPFDLLNLVVVVTNAELECYVLNYNRYKSGVGVWTSRALCITYKLRSVRCSAPFGCTVYWHWEIMSVYCRWTLLLFCSRDSHISPHWLWWIDVCVCLGL